MKKNRPLSMVAWAVFSIFGSIEFALLHTHAQGLSGIVAQQQAKVVKIMGSGGFQGLEPYQSGFLISDDGVVLTVWSYVLDSDVVIVTLDDGQRFEAKLMGYDPRIDIALLKIPASNLVSFDLEAAAQSKPGTPVLAFSNLYGVATGNEPVSVQQGVVAATAKLTARRGAFSTPYREQALILDAITNNPGAAGGAVTNLNGELLGVIGKELKDENTNTWLNFAIPIDRLVESVRQIRSGKMIVQSGGQIEKPAEPITTELLGIVLVPDVVAKTPPFVDRTMPRSPAEQDGLIRDDLIIEINGNLTPSIKEVLRQLSQIDRDDEFEITVQRAGEFVNLTLGLLR